MEVTMLRTDRWRKSALPGLMAGLLGLAGSAPGQFNLTSPDGVAFEFDRGRAAVVSFEPRLSYTVEAIPERYQELDCLPLSTEGLDPVEDWDLIAMAKAGSQPASIPSTTGALVALPGAAVEWSYEVTPASRAAAVTVSEVVVGTQPCLHVVVDRGLAGDVGEEIDIQLFVEALNDGKAPRRQLGDGGESERIARSIFLNGGDLASIPMRTLSAERSRSDVVMPEPPGDIRVTYSTGNGLLAIPLAELGVSADDVGTLRLNHHGNLLPVLTVADDHAIVYAPRRQTMSDENDSIFVTVDELAPSPTVGTRAAFDTLTPGGSEVAMQRSRVFRMPLRYERASTLPVGDRFVAYRIQRPNTIVTPLAVNDHLTDPNVFIQVRLLGLDTNTSHNPDHFADVSLAGVAMPRIEWKGRTQTQRAQNVEITLPNAPSLSFSHTVPSVVSISDLQNLRDVTLAWTGYPRVDSSGRGIVETTAGAASHVTVGGFPVGTTAENLLVLDITNPVSPQILDSPAVFADVSGTVAVEFETPGAVRKYFVQRIDAAEAPSAVVEAELLPQPTGPEEVFKGIYIREPILAEVLEPLVTMQGSGVLELDPQAAYNAYNGGQKSPEAIRSALKDLFQGAEQRELLPAVVLVGYGTFDPRNYTGEVTFPEVPPFIEASSLWDGIEIENSVDYYYATLVGDDIFEDAQVSRLPVKSPAELEPMVNRILAHKLIEESLGEAKRPGVFIGDNPSAGDLSDFRLDSEVHADRFEATGHSSILIKINGSREPGYTQFKTAMETDAGVSLVLYTGHGSTQRWADETFVHVNDIPNIDTSNRWPFVTSFTCLNSYYAQPGVTTIPMAKSWLLAPERGAIATLTPSSAETYYPQYELALRFLDLLGLPPGLRPETVGELTTRTRIEFLTDLPHLGRPARTYLLFGDPTSNLTIPALVDTDYLWIY
jgi:hypothetical protein